MVGLLLILRKLSGGEGIIELCAGYIKSEIPTRYSSSDFKKEVVI